MTTVSIPAELTSLRAELSKLRIELAAARNLIGELEDELEYARKDYRATLEDITKMCDTILENIK